MKKRQKANLLEQMTAAYDRASDMEDIGERIFALKKLAGGIEKIETMFTPDGKKKAKENGIGYTLLTAGAVTAGVTLATPEAIAWYFDTFLGFASFLVGGTVFEISRNAYISQKYNDKGVSYVRDVMPYLPALKDLSATARRDIDNLLVEKNAPALRESRHLSKLMSEYPTLVDIFKSATQKEYELQKLSPKPEDKGFSL